MGFMTEAISWGHPLAWSVYVYVGLSLMLAGALFWLRQNVIHPQRDSLLQEAAMAHEQITAAKLQLVQINRQFDRGLDQLEQMLNLIQGLFLALLETRLMTSAMLRLRKHPIWIKLAVKKGIDTVFAQAEAVVRTHHIKDRDEAAHEQRIP